MRQTWKNRLLALALVFCTMLSICTIPASAASIADGSKTCSVALAPVHNYLQTTAGTWLRAGGYNYNTNDGLAGPAYCIDHGLSFTDKVLPITGKYDASPPLPEPSPTDTLSIRWRHFLASTWMKTPSCQD